MNVEGFQGFMCSRDTTQTSGADKPGTFLVLPTFHLFLL